jgi:hypothetical protein
MYNPESTPPVHDPLAIEVFLGREELKDPPSRFLTGALVNELAAAAVSGAPLAKLIKFLNQTGEQICERAPARERDGEMANTLCWAAVKIRSARWKVIEISDESWIPWEQRRIGGYYGLPPRDLRQAVYTRNEFAEYRAARGPGKVNPDTGRRIWRPEIEQFKKNKKFKNNEALAKNLGVGIHTLRSIAAGDDRHGLNTEQRVLRQIGIDPAHGLLAADETPRQDIDFK